MEEENQATIDQALSNLEKETFDGDRPESNTTGPGISGGRNAFEERRVRDYLMEWYEETTDNFSVDWSQVTIIVSGRLKNSNGRCRANYADDTQELKIAKNLFREQERGDWKQTVRHEAVHVWQAQVHETIDHGRTFRIWMDEFDITIYAENPAEQPKYEILCPNCGVVDTKQRECKTVRHVDRYRCSVCDSDELFVRQNR